MDVLVTGATGFIGSRLVPRLLESSRSLRSRSDASPHIQSVSVLTRNASRYDGPSEVSVYEGDLLDPGSFDEALSDVNAAYYLVHSMGAGTDFAERDRRAANNFAVAATEADLSRVVYLSGLGSDTDQLSDHLRSRREVESVLRLGSYELTTLRAAIVIGAGSTSFDMIRQLVSRFSILFAPKWVHTECQPIAIDDVLSYLVGVLASPGTAGETFEIGGPERITYSEFLERTAAALGYRLLVVPAAGFSLDRAAICASLFTDVHRDVARALVSGMRNTVVTDDARITEHVTVDRLPIDRAIERALDRSAAVGNMPARSAPDWDPWTLGLGHGQLKPR